MEDGKAVGGSGDAPRHKSPSHCHQPTERNPSSSSNSTVDYRHSNQQQKRRDGSEKDLTVDELAECINGSTKENTKKKKTTKQRPKKTKAAAAASSPATATTNHQPSPTPPPLEAKKTVKKKNRPPLEEPLPPAAATAATAADTALSVTSVAAAEGTASVAAMENSDNNGKKKRKKFGGIKVLTSRKCDIIKLDTHLQQQADEDSIRQQVGDNNVLKLCGEVPVMVKLDDAGDLIAGEFELS